MPVPTRAVIFSVPWQSRVGQGVSPRSDTLEVLLYSRSMSPAGRPTKVVRSESLELGDAIRSTRRLIGLSREDLARRASVSTNTLMAIEQKRVADPGVFLIGRIAAAMGTTLDEIIPTQRPASPPASGIVSIGYEGHDLQTFLGTLDSYGVTMVADVRLTPLSRKLGFSKTRLSAALQERGIEYRHFRDLGNPKDNRDEFRKGSRVALERFSQLLKSATARTALGELTKTARSQMVAVMCFEHDHCDCHRKMIIDLIHESGSMTVRLA